MTTQMSKTAAMEQARNESSISRFGDDWKVVTWSPRDNAWYERTPGSWETMSRYLTKWRHSRTLELMGWDAIEARDFAYHEADYYRGGSLRERVNASLSRAA